MRTTAERRGRPDRNRCGCPVPESSRILSVNPRRGYPDRSQAGSARNLDLRSETRNQLRDQIGLEAAVVPFTATGAFSYTHNFIDLPDATVLDGDEHEVGVCINHVDRNTVVVSFRGTITDGLLILN